MIKILEFCDFIGPEPKLFINGTYRYKSTLGGILTITVCMLSVLCFVGFGKDIIVKEMPQVSSTNILNMDQKLEVNETMYVIGISRRGGFTIDNLERKLKFQIQVIDTDTKRRPSGLYYAYDLIPCNGTKIFQENRYNILDSLITGTDMYFCLPHNFTTSLQGKYGESKFISYAFFVK
jgi:hypothetical protein